MPTLLDLTALTPLDYADEAGDPLEQLFPAAMPDFFLTEAFDRASLGQREWAGMPGEEAYRRAMASLAAYYPSIREHSPGEWGDGCAVKTVTFWEEVGEPIEEVDILVDSRMGGGYPTLTTIKAWARAWARINLTISDDPGVTVSGERFGLYL